LFGGSPSLPPNYYLFERRLEYHKHQIYSEKLGILVMVTQGSLVMPGDLLYRLYSGDSEQLGHFYTPANPALMEDAPSELGLPSGNTAERMVIVKLNGPPEGLPIRPVDPLGQTGGAPEVFVENPKAQVAIQADVSADFYRLRVYPSLQKNSN